MVPEQNSKTILLVEDEALIALSEKRVLEDAGYRAMTAYSGEKALALLEQEPSVDLVLMDIDLGRGPDGTEIADRILRERDMPVVFLSSHTEPEVVRKTEGITSYGYIVKSSGDVVLLASIKMAFRLFEAKRSLKDELRHREELESSLLERNENLTALLEVSRSLSATLDLQTVLQVASDSLARFSGLNTAAVYLIDEGILELRAATPPIPEDFPRDFRLAAVEDHPHIGRAIETRSPVIIEDLNAEKLTDAEREVAAIRGLKSIAYFPLNSGERAIGVLITGSTARSLSSCDSTNQLCATLANIAAVAAENAIQFERVNQFL